MQELYNNLILRTFAFSCVSFFVPIYLLFYINLTFEVVVLFFAVLFSVMAAFSPIALVIAQRIGLKNAVVVSLPFSIVFFLMLYRMGEGMMYPLWIIALVGGIGESLYFTALNIDFAINTKKEFRGYNIGVLDSFFKSSALVGPVFGAGVIVYLGFELLFGVVLVVLMLCLIPALQVRVRREKFGISFKRIVCLENARYMPAFFAYGVMSAAEWFLWPVFVYAVLDDVWGVALAVALVAFGSAIFAGFFRSAGLKYSLSSFLRCGALIYAITWVLRVGSSVALDIYLLSFLSGIVIVLVYIPFLTDTIERAREVGVAEFICFREIAVSLGRVAFFWVLVMALAQGWSVYALGFGVAAVACGLFFGG